MTKCQTSSLGRLSPLLVAKAIGGMLFLALVTNSVVKFQKEQGDWFAWALSATVAFTATVSIGECKDTLVPIDISCFLKKKRKSFFLHRDLADELDRDYVRRKLTVALHSVGVCDGEAVEAVLVAIGLLDCNEKSKFYVSNAWAVLVNFDTICSEEEGLLVQIIKRVRP